MASCEALSSINPNFPVITKDNVNEIVPSSFAVNNGASVTVRCNDPYELVGQANLVCNNGRWNYATKPYCQIPGEEDQSALDTDTKVIIGVVCGIAAIIIAILVIMIIIVWLRDRRRRRERQKLWSSITRRDGYPYRYRDRDGPSTIDMEMYSHTSPPPPYGDYRKGPIDRSYRDYDRDSRFSSPMYLPDRKPDYRDYYDEIKKSRKSPRYNDGYSDKGNKPYVREWISRNSVIGQDDLPNHPAVHGRYGGGYLWRN